MKKSAAFLVLVAWLCPACAWAAEEHPAKGFVLDVSAAHRSLVVSCEAIPGYMDAMEMSFVVRNAKELVNLKSGEMVHFVIVGHGKELYAEKIEVIEAKNFEAEPMEAGGLTMLHAALRPSTAAQMVAVGQRVPDFALTDQAHKKVHLSQFQGKVVALTFGYSRCPNPNYCYRLSNNLAQVEKRFHNRAGSDLVLLTIAIDPEHDQGAALTQYANTWRADPSVWHFLTGSVAEIKQVAGMFGMDFWNDDGFLTHTLHTVIIDRKGQLAANIVGNQFTVEQLGDLVQVVMNRPQ